MRSAISTAMLALSVVAPSSTPEPDDPHRIFQWDPAVLRETKRRVEAGDDSLRSAVDRLRREAERARRQTPVSVTDNDLQPPSGDAHDYYSFGPYWWPNPETPDGLPYIRRDGQTNPRSHLNADDGALGDLCDAVKTLALAYYLFEDEDDAEHAARLLRTWFLDPRTRMNPHLRYGQAVPGRADGRCYGIIETRGLIDVVDAVGLIQESDAWTEADHRGLVAWFSRYLDWLRTSDLGQAEAATRNNHGSWYDAQVTAFALFVGRESLARSIVEASKSRRIARQIEPDGRQPFELARTRSFDYSVFNLRALMTLARLGDRVGVDLWSFETPDGRGIQRAAAFLAPFADDRKPWPGRQIREIDRDRLVPVIRQAAVAYPDAGFARWLTLFSDRELSDDSIRLFLPSDSIQDD